MIVKKFGWKIKYYKGLGTSNRKEAQNIFQNLKTITYIEDENSNNAIIKAFSKDQELIHVKNG